MSAQQDLLELTLDLHREMMRKAKLETEKAEWEARQARLLCEHIEAAIKRDDVAFKMPGLKS
jgi:hypothetical protein